MRVAMVVAAMAAGCAHAPERQAKMAEPVKEFRAEAWALDTRAPDAKHHDAVRALRELGRAVRTLPIDSSVEARDIDEQASAVEGSSAHANHSGPVKRALDDAVTVLMRLPAAHPALAERVRVARASIDKIDPSVPYLQEKAVIDDAFTGVANAFVIAGLPVEQKAPLPSDTRVVRLERYAFDQAGQNPNVQEACGPAGAQSVVLKRRVSDLVLGVVSLGWYTPVHARISCRS